MSNPTNCPQCNSENIYEDGNVWVCPMCSHEWNAFQATGETPTLQKDSAIRDAYGNILNSGDSVTVIKDLKIKGSSSVVKVGTKVKNIRLIEAEDGHDIACKIEGIGSINLKSEYVKKA